MSLIGSVFLLLSCATLVLAVPKCPSACFCSKGLISVNCGGKRLMTIPPDIPPQVEKLYLQSNKISVIPPYAFSKFIHLQYLDLRQNIISTIDDYSFSNCSQLQKLYLTANTIVSISPKAFLGSPEVTFLNLGANLLKAIPSLPSLVNLQSLILEANKLSNATFPESFLVNTALVDLVMSNNMIGSIDNKTFRSLGNATVKKVEISRSGIKSVESGTFLPLEQLMSLKIGYNPLDSSQLQNVIKGLSNTSLVSLDIRNLSLAGRLPSETFLLLRNTPIRTLIMRNNKIINIPEGAFANLPKLLLIDLTACHIQTVSDVAFKNLSVLQTLFLNDNSLARVPRGFPKTLTKLYLNNNQFGRLENEVFSNLKTLEELYLVENNIHELQEYAFLGLSQLRKLYLGYNQIATLPGKLFNPFTRLVSLELNNNAIRQIPESPGRLSSLKSLEYLNLNNNDLSAMPLDILNPLQSLKYLHADNNKLGVLIAKDISGTLFKGLSKLQELYLSNNAIDTLPESLLSEQRSLRIFNMSTNRISHWGQNFFVTTESLQTVDFCMNLISLINETSVNNLRSVQYLNLSGNPFACNCNARWFCGWMNTTKVDLPFRSQYQCNLPADWQGKSMASFCAKDIDCTDYTLYYIIAGVAGGCFISLIVFGIMYRYRWYVKHRFYRIGKCLRMVKRTKAGYTHLPGDDKRYDIYLSYADEDATWVAENILKKLDCGTYCGDKCDGKYEVCFRERDFQAGRGILSSMDECIPASRKVMIIGTVNYMKCRQCEYELDQVMNLHMEKVVSDYILVTRGKLPPNVPKPIERMLQRHTYTEWVDPAVAQTAFLERVTDLIGAETIGNHETV